MIFFKKYAPAAFLFLLACGQTPNGINFAPLAVEQREYEGALPKEDIDLLIRGNLQGIRKCFETAVEKNNTLKGKVVSDFVIGKSGNVTSFNVKESTLLHPPTEACIGSEIMKLQFPRSKTSTTRVIYPFLFRVAEK